MTDPQPPVPPHVPPAEEPADLPVGQEPEVVDSFAAEPPVEVPAEPAADPEPPSQQAEAVDSFAAEPAAEPVDAPSAEPAPSDEAPEPEPEPEPESVPTLADEEAVQPEPVEEPVEPEPVEPEPVEEPVEPEPPALDPGPDAPAPQEPTAFAPPAAATDTDADVPDAAGDPVPDDPFAAPAPDADAEDRVAARRGRTWVPLTALGVTAALLTAGTGYLAWQVREQARAETAREEATASARDAARLLFSYNHETLQADFDKGLSVTTGEFRDQYRRTTQDVVSDVAKEYKAVVVAEVIEAAIVQAEASRVTALVFLNQATTSTRVQGQQVDQSRVRMQLVLRDGRWLVDAVSAL